MTTPGIFLAVAPEYCERPVDFSNSFWLTCLRGLATTPNGVEFQGKIVSIGAFPIGIDPEKFTEGLKKPKVQERIATLERKFQGVKIMVGVDRLDYIKGVPQKLHALEVFLTEHPEWVGKVVLVQVAVPSRQDVEEYQNLRAVVNELVGRINGKFGMYSGILLRYFGSLNYI